VVDGDCPPNGHPGTNDWSGCHKYSPFADKCGAEFEAAFTAKYVEYMTNITRWYNSTDIQVRRPTTAAAPPLAVRC
jgi:hypothetical protein